VAETTRQADLDSVSESSIAFSDMLDNLRDATGVTQSIDTNAIDLGSFVAGKSINDLLLFLDTAVTRPVAAKQVAAYILTNTTDSTTYISAAVRYADLLDLAGDESDRAAGQSALDGIITIYEEELPYALDSAEGREEIMTLMHRYYGVLGWDQDTLQRLYTSWRAHGKTEVEYAYASEFEARWLMIRNQPGDREMARNLWQTIYDSGTFGRFFARRDVVENYMDHFDELAVKVYDTFSTPVDRLSEPKDLSAIELIH